jgi:parallel beta-helix repeat protein
MKMKGMARSGLVWKLIALIALTILFCAAFTASVVSAEVIYVPDDYLTIQAAVDAAGFGDTIIVRDGTYTENIKVNKGVTIKSENGAALTTVNAANYEDHVFEVTADYVNISGFTVRDAHAGLIAGIYLGDNVDHCTISDNIAAYNDYGIWLYCSNSNHICNNTASNNYVGIYLMGSGNNHLEDNTASSNFDNGILLLSTNIFSLTFFRINHPNHPLSRTSQELLLAEIFV